MADIGIIAAFIAGVLALLSPCGALLLPSFFAYAFTSHTRLITRTAVFTLGLMLVLIPLGMGMSAVSQVFYGHRALLVTISGWVIIGFGVLLVLGRSFATPFAGRIQNATSGWTGIASSRSGWLGWIATLGLGSVYGLAGFCSGPALGAVLTVAATAQQPTEGAALLAVYGLGMALPLFLLALTWERFELAKRSWLRGREINLGPLRVHTTHLIGGLIFILIGTLFLLFDGTAGLTGMVGIDLTGVEMAAQQWVMQVFGTVPVWTVPAAIAVVAFAYWLVQRRSQRTR